jgi:hypothetical protein
MCSAIFFFGSPGCIPAEPGYHDKSRYRISLLQMTLIVSLYFAWQIQSTLDFNPGKSIFEMFPGTLLLPRELIPRNQFQFLEGTGTFTNA